ncbi:MAG: Gfo/Idh/MocA family oxidoreductase [Pseudotabrizicola sp.]|uniref:Gfo/Idh/MocA family protein n=1 Tax=Pseudotabrizicola sp. TaxID=2939647 RepID=UPI0027279C99|nr:Gfo/Idh/MocA family oxidoreductase [Pseudotabrizicola sp.]MDO8884466.1 Gfo/Idh/MocA family oxidoreductase [Pseudotabrizicola sp.]MDP2081351.1 Gfo/Idh/MocA family oxidoreductase [Pseudotabrizicola sp.]MDZ7576030.1 Gfo/Idh/MocA family oxidoreductase [Pseudotabrizicola sp.]
MKNLKVAIAGAGAISEFHLKGWLAQDAVTLVAICDPDREKAQLRADEFGIAEVFTGVAEMLAATRPDAVDIITPVGSHASLVRMAAACGVHVICQKPMTPTVAEAEALIADVGEGVRFMVHENYRFRPHYAEIARRVRAGEIGRLRHARLTVRSSSLFDYPGRVPFLLGRQPYLAQFKRLLVFEVLIHHLDALRSILGEMEVLSARLDRINPDLMGEDVALVTLRSADGALIQMDANISALGYPPLPTDRLELLGDADTLIYDRDRISRLSQPEIVSLHDLTANYQACFTGAVTEFVTGLRNGTPFATDRLDNLETLRLMESIYRAAGVNV